MNITIKEAVKDCRDLIEEYKDCSVEGLNMHIDVGFNEDRYRNLEKILNELETYKYYYEELTTGLNNSSNRVTDLTRENTQLRYQLFNANKELKEKDKIIDAMAEEINFMVNMGEWISNNDIKKLDYKEEVKQYFERKVENE